MIEGGSEKNVSGSRVEGVKFELETVTPLFLGGADPRGEPELRAASIRGALRFWLRALLGGFTGDDIQGLESLRKAESEIFGSTQVGASRLTVRVLAPGKPTTQPFRVLPHSTSKTFKASAIKPGERFYVHIAPRPPHVYVPSIAWAATLLLLLLGGLGKRARRGFGSLALRRVQGELPFPIPDYSSPESFPELLSLTIEKAQKERTAFAQSLPIANSSLSNPPRFPVLHDEYAKILFCRYPFKTWDQAMESFWSLLRSNGYRDNPVFGFAGRQGRQASPLHLRVLRCSDGYHVLLTAFRVRFHHTQPPWKIMQKFLDECGNKYGGVWVIGGDIEW